MLLCNLLLLLSIFIENNYSLLRSIAVDRIWENGIFVKISAAALSLLFYHLFLGVGWHALTAFAGYCLAAYLSVTIISRIHRNNWSNWVHPILFLIQLLLMVLAISAIVYTFQLFESNFRLKGIAEFLYSFHFARFLFASIVTMAIVLAVKLATTSGNSKMRSYHSDALVLSVAVIILYIHGEYDRFVISDNPLEDLSDFAFTVGLVIILWSLFKTITSLINKVVIANPTRQFTFQSIALVATLIPADIFLNWIYLKIVYGFDLYTDYWAIELPLKTLLIVLLNKYTHSTNKALEEKRRLRISNGANVSWIDIDEIAFCAVHQQVTYLATFDGKRHIADVTLSKLSSQLKNDFFQASRQLLICKSAVVGYRRKPSKKLELTTVPVRGLPQSFTISRLTAPSFKKWITSESE